MALIPIRNTAELAVDPVSGDSNRKNVIRMAYIVFHMEWRADSGSDCLHLCRNMLYSNPDHLVLEPRSIYNNRNHCKNGMHCFGHGRHRKCLI